MYKVWLSCAPDCEDWEADRVMFEETDPAKAIERAAILRDHMHESWIEEVKA